MGILSAYRQNLFKDATPLHLLEKSPVFEYNVAPYIQYNKSNHWIIYDFKNEKIFKKEMDEINLVADFTENRYKNEKGTEVSIDFNKYVESFGKNGTMIECQIHTGKYILGLFKESNLSEDALFYNLYHTHIRNKIYQKTETEIQNLKYRLISSLNWVWFRKPNAFLTQKTVNRSMSWIQNNPEFKFHLWTNLKDEEEMKEFFSKTECKELLEKTTIHYKDETWGLARSFCDEVSRNKTEFNYLWNSYEEILNDSTNKASMLFKTDVIRNMILYMNGGWYADFNDTYCFVPLKYIVNHEAREMIHFGADNETLHNNYIMYSPKNNSKWLDTTMKTLEASIQMYKILKVKDERFNMVCHFIVREVIDSILNLPGATLMDRVVNKAETLTVLYNKEIADMFIRSGITEKFLKDSDFKIVFKKDNILLLVRYLLECINPNSVVYHRFVYELELMKNLNKGKNGRFNIVWKINKDELTPFIASDYEADCKAIKSHIMTPVDFYNVMMYVNTNKFIIYLTNMGSYFHNNEDAKKYVYTIPYCFVLKAMCFLTGLGHIGDGTACGFSKQLNYDNTI